MNDQINQLIDLFLTDPETGEDCVVCSPLEQDGEYSTFHVRSKSGNIWKHSFKTEEV